MALRRDSATFIVFALAVVFLGTKVFGAPTGADFPNVNLVARDTPPSGPNFEPARDKPLLAPRAPVSNAEAEAEANAEAWDYGRHCHSQGKRDADADPEAAAWSGPSCGVGHVRRMLESAATLNPNKHVEVRDALGSGVNFESVQDKPLLAARAPAPEADANAEADAEGRLDH